MTFTQHLLRLLRELANYIDCGKAGCTTCQMVMQLLEHPAVEEYIASRVFRAGKIPIETAMCDNFKGWDNELGILSNVCLPHGTGKVHYSL